MAKYEFTDECITESGCTMHLLSLSNLEDNYV